MGVLPDAINHSYSDIFYGSEQVLVGNEVSVKGKLSGVLFIWRKIDLIMKTTMRK